MLRDTKAQPLRSSILRRGTVLALTMLVGLFVAGLRPPTLRDAVAQESATTETIQERQGFNLENVTASTVVLFGLRPSQIAERSDMKQVVAIVEESLESEKTGLYIEDIDQYLVFASDPPNSGLIPVMEIRMKEPTDFGPFLKELVGDVELLAVGNESILVLGDSASPAQSLAAYQPDDRTVLFGAQPSIENLATRQNHQSDQPAWSVRFQPFADGEACLLIDVAQFRPQFQHAFQRNPNPMLGMFAPLWEEADLAIGGARLGDRLTATLNIWGKDTESADKIEQTLRTLIPVGQGMLQGYKASLERMPNDTQAVVKPIIDFAGSVLSDVQIEKSDEQVDVTFEGDGASLAIATVVALPALQQAREAARRTQSQNNLKQIGLAFHLYHDAHGHFPPPVLIGPDDKTPYSWRVAVLPFLDQKALYEQYDRTQPWDSEHNQKVLEQMPPQFKSPNDDAGSTNAAYFVLTGQDTAAGETNGEGTKIPDITDGMANTLLVVESKLDIPWTKPEDIPYSPDTALPKFGGFHKPGFFGLRADGSVTYFSEHIDENLLRALITRNGGEDIQAN